jgi:AraC-like DNA-binding protein
MVTIQSKMVVKSELTKLGISFKTIDFGSVEVVENINPQQKKELESNLKKSGLLLLNDTQANLLEKVKEEISEVIHNNDELPKVNFSDYLSQRLNHDYNAIAKLFAETEGKTIEHYILINKIEKVKELILYKNLKVNQIAQKLQYKSPEQLSKQFKKITGVTPSYFKSLREKKQSLLESL